jgi:hypothetical protein
MGSFTNGRKDAPGEAPGVIATFAAAIAHAAEANAQDIEASAAELRIFHHYLANSCQRNPGREGSTSGASSRISKLTD